MSSKRSKIHSSISPSSIAYYGQIEFPTPLSASSKFSKLEMSDTESITIFLESLNAWLNGYFFSKLSLENSQLPLPPRLENLELFETCSSLRISIGKIRELALKKISTNEEKNKETMEKPKTLTTVKSKITLKSDTEEKKVNQILDHTIREAKKNGLVCSGGKGSLLEKCENLCYGFLSIGKELQVAKAKVKNLESVLESTKTHRIDEGHSLNISKQSTDCNLMQVIYPLIGKIQSLQEKKKFYSLLYRHYERFLAHEEVAIRELLDTSKAKGKKKISLKIIGICVVFSIRIRNFKGNEEKMTIRGVKFKLLDANYLNMHKALTFKTLPNLVSSIHKTIGGHSTERATLNSLISASISGFQKFMNDIKTVLSILLKNNTEQKEAVITLSQNIKEIEEERDEIEGALTRTVEYTKNLEEEIMELTEDPEYLSNIGEKTEMTLELESHKKALKGFTSQYNQLERKMDELVLKYEELKKDNEEKAKLLQKFEGKSLKKK